MTCERFETDLALHVEGDLLEAVALRIEGHLASCERCRAFLHDLRASQRAVETLGEEAVPEDALRRVRSRVVDAIGRRRGSRASLSPAWAWAIAASVTLVVAGLAVSWRTRTASPPPAVETARVLPPQPVPSGTARVPVAAAETAGTRSLAPTRPTVGRGRQVSPDEDQAMTAQEARLSPEEADQLARAVVAVSEIASLSDLPRHEEAEGEPSSGRFARLATDDPDVVIYWQLDANGE